MNLPQLSELQNGEFYGMENVIVYSFLKFLKIFLDKELTKIVYY